MIGGGDGLPIAARAPIGDRSSGALVGADGTIDWWCPGSFDSPAAFFGLVDSAGGACRLGPVGVPVMGTQRWRGDGPVVSTELAGPETRVRLDDALIGGSITRVLTVLRGPVDVMLDVVPGRRFGSPRKVEHFSSGVAFDGIVVRGLADAVGHRMDSGEQFQSAHARHLVVRDHNIDRLGGEHGQRLFAAGRGERPVGFMAHGAQDPVEQVGIVIDEQDGRFHDGLQVLRIDRAQVRPAPVRRCW